MVLLLLHLALLSIIAYSLYTLSARCTRLEAENRVYRWFFKQQAYMETKYMETSEAMLRVADEQRKRVQNPPLSRR